jgi:hypothetical protein
MIHGREFLEVADALAKHPGEAFDRTRVGRVYYGTWLEARAFCEERLGYSRKGLAREHQVVAELLGTLDEVLETHLKILRFARNQADYDDFLPEDHFDDLLRTVLVSSSWVLSRLDSLRDMAPE